MAIRGGASINSLVDTTITSVGDNELLQYDSGTSKWINQTLAEAGISATSHTHDTLTSTNSTLILSDDATDATLTGNLGNLVITPTSKLVISKEVSLVGDDDTRFAGSVGGLFTSQVADANSNTSFIFEPDFSKDGVNVVHYDLRDENQNTLLSIHKIRTDSGGDPLYGVEILGRNTSGDGIMLVGGSTEFNMGINFIPFFVGPGNSLGGQNDAVAMQYNTAKCTTGATWVNAIGVSSLMESTSGYTATVDTVNLFSSYANLQGSNNSMTSVTHYRVFAGLYANKNCVSVTNHYGAYIENITTNTSKVTNLYGIVVDEQTGGATIKNGIFLAQSTSGYKALAIRDQDIYIGSNDDGRLDLTADTAIDLNADVDLTSGQSVQVTTITGATTLDTTHYVVLCNSASAFTVTLPAAASNTGRKYIVKNINTGAVTVDGNASETIDGDTTKIISTQYDSLQMVCDGSNWHIV